MKPTTRDYRDDRDEGDDGEEERDEDEMRMRMLKLSTVLAIQHIGQG